MSDLDLCYMGATDALALFRAKKLSPVELMKAVIARAETVNKKVNAFTFTYFDEALVLTKRWPPRARRRPSTRRPGHGWGLWRACRSGSRTRAGSQASRPRMAP